MPMSSRYCTAAPSPTTCDVIGTPASNRCGGRRERGGLHRDGLDHRAAGDERRHRGEQLAAAVQHADSRRAEHLVPGERREVDVEFAEVDRHVRHRLARVEHDERADGPCPPDQLLDGRDAPVTLDWCVNATTLTASVSSSESRSIRPVVRDAVPAQRRAGTARKFLPRHEIRVMLEFGDHDLVTGAERMRETIVAEDVRHQVERLGGVLGEHHLVGVDTDERRRWRRGHPRTRPSPPPPMRAHLGGPRRCTS